MDPVRLELDGIDAGAVRDALRASDDAYSADVDAGQLPAAVAELCERALRAPAISDETDNGYRNHETFLAAMQLAGNMTPGGADELARVQRVVDRARSRSVMTRSAEDPPTPRLDVADELRAYLEQLASHRSGGPWTQELATAALGRVDWLQLADEQLAQLAELRPSLDDRVAAVLRRVNPDEPSGEWSAWSVAQAIGCRLGAVQELIARLVPSGGRFVGGTSRYLYWLEGGEREN